MSAFITPGVSGRPCGVREGNDSRTKVVSFQNEAGAESSRAPHGGKAPANPWATSRGASLTFPISLFLFRTRLLTSSPSPPSRSYLLGSMTALQKYWTESAKIQLALGEKQCNFRPDEKSNNIFARPLQLAIDEVWPQTAENSPASPAGVIVEGKLTSAPSKRYFSYRTWTIKEKPTDATRITFYSTNAVMTRRVQVFFLFYLNFIYTAIQNTTT